MKIKQQSDKIPKQQGNCVSNRIWGKHNHETLREKKTKSLCCFIIKTWGQMMGSKFLPRA